MKRSRLRDIPPRAAMVVVALVLLASVVTGREPVIAPPIEAQDKRPSSAPPVPTPPLPLGDLDLDKLVRQPRANEAPDLFAARLWTPPPAPMALPAKPEPPPAPTAPPLPFKYLGRLVDGEKTIVFLARAQETLSATVGETLSNTYRIESINDTVVQFTYLPLGTVQSLSLPPRP